MRQGTDQSEFHDDAVVISFVGSFRKGGRPDWRGGVLGVVVKLVLEGVEAVELRASVSEVFESLFNPNGRGDALFAWIDHRVKHVQLVLSVHHKNLQHVAQAPHIQHHHADVHALGSALETNAALDEVLGVDDAGALAVEHLEDAASALDIDPHGHEVRLHPVILQLIAELCPRYGTAAVSIGLHEEALQLLNKALHLVQLVQDSHLLVQLRQLCGLVHEDTCHDVEDAQDNEDEEDDEYHSVDPMDRQQALHDLVVVPAASDALKD
mmetsp:Transcript_48724/g.110356  ORF Transcript_48724/g.110356 Transcript_48724/m.110356 type:complete len:267 (-) Transcript_48724:1306-2106(-)